MEVNGPSGKLEVAGVLLISVFLIGFGSYSYMAQSSALTDSVAVNGTIQSSSVVEVDSRRDVDYRPEVSYTYTVNGTEYMSTSIYPGPTSPDFDSREAARLDYEKGDQVKVYLSDMNSPEESFLKHESSNRPFLFVAVGLLMIGYVAYSKFS